MIPENTNCNDTQSNDQSQLPFKVCFMPMPVLYCSLVTAPSAGCARTKQGSGAELCFISQPSSLLKHSCTKSQKPLTQKQQCNNVSIAISYAILYCILCCLTRSHSQNGTKSSSRLGLSSHNLTPTLRHDLSVPHPHNSPQTKTLTNNPQVSNSLNSTLIQSILHPMPPSAS